MAMEYELRCDHCRRSYWLSSGLWRFYVVSWRRETSTGAPEERNIRGSRHSLVKSVHGSSSRFPGKSRTSDP